MAGIGDAILSLIGRPDPREQLVREVLGGGAGGSGQPGEAQRQALVAQQHVQSGRNPDGSERPPAQPSGTPEAYQSPPELSELMSAMMKRQAQAQGITAGIGNIAAGFSRPEHRADTLAAFGVGGAGGAGAGGAADGFGANSMFGQVLKVREQQVAFNERQRQRAAIMSRIPGIARATGMSEDALIAQYEADPAAFAKLVNDGAAPYTLGYGDRRGVGTGIAVDAIHKPETLAPGHTVGTLDGGGNFVPTYTAPVENRDFRQATAEEAARFNAAAGQFGPDGRFYPLNPPSGTSLETGPDGTVRFVQGAGAGQRPLTESQSKDTVYSTRAKGAGGTLTQYESALTNPADAVAGNVPVVGNFAVSENYQRARQAGDEWLSAILRKDTGAAITNQEMETYGRTYLPRPGDTPAVIEQKRQARVRAEEALQSGMPAEAILQREEALRRADEREQQQTATAQPPTPAPSAPAGGGRGDAGTPVRVQSKAEYDSLPAGTAVILPNGKAGVKQ